jgi:hypothetical protein
MRKILLLTLSLALLAAPSALADKGGEHRGNKPGGRPPATAQPASGAAPAVITAASPVACNRFAGKKVKFKIRGHVQSVGPSGIVVIIEKANGNFVKAARATRSGGTYAAAPGTSNVAFIPFGDCTRVKRDGSGRWEQHRRGHVPATGSACVRVGGAMVWHKRAGLICVGDRVQVEWKAPKKTLVATGLGAPNRIEVKGSG